MTPGWTFTQHALDRLLDMAVKPEEIQRTLLRGQYRRHKTRPDQEYVTAGRLTFVVSTPDDEGTRRVITALWADQHNWKLDASRPGYGRKFDRNPTIRSKSRR